MLCRDVSTSASCPHSCPLQMIPLHDGKHLLPRRRVAEMDKKCVVIDLDETLVHSSFKVCN